MSLSTTYFPLFHSQGFYSVVYYQFIIRSLSWIFFAHTGIPFLDPRHRELLQIHELPLAGVPGNSIDENITGA